MRLTLRAIFWISLLAPGVVSAQVAVVEGDSRWPATAVESDKAGEAAGPAKPYEPIGQGVDVGVGSAYGFRGLNLVQEKSQRDQRLVLQRSLSYEVPDTGLNVAHFSSCRLWGENDEQYGRVSTNVGTAL